MCCVPWSTVWLNTALLKPISCIGGKVYPILGQIYTMTSTVG